MLKHIDRQVLEYSPSAGLPSLREKLREYYHRFNIEVDVDDIIVTTGGSEAVLFAFMACLDPGDEIIVPEPAYANYMAFAISAGAKIVTVPQASTKGSPSRLSRNSRSLSHRAQKASSSATPTIRPATSTR